MRKPSSLTVYLADANVLLNLSALGRLDVLRRCADCLDRRNVVPRCILDEIEGEISAQDLVVRGVRLVEPEAAIAAKLVVARMRDGLSSRLSDADAELYVVLRLGILRIWFERSVRPKQAMRAFDASTPFAPETAEFGIIRT